MRCLSEMFKKYTPELSQYMTVMGMRYIIIFKDDAGKIIYGYYFTKIKDYICKM